MTRSLAQLHDGFRKMGCTGAVALIKWIHQTRETTFDDVPRIRKVFGEIGAIVLGSDDGTVTVEDSLEIMLNGWAYMSDVDQAWLDYLLLRIAVEARTGKDIVLH